MSELIAKWTTKNGAWIASIGRVLFALMLFMHASMKLWGLFGSGKGAAIFSLFWFAGIIEIIIVVMLILGLFVRLAAIIGAIEMIVALCIAHFPVSWNPFVNHGEPALLFLAAYLVFIVYGAGACSLDKKCFKKEVF